MKHSNRFHNFFDNNGMSHIRVRDLRRSMAIPLKKTAWMGQAAPRPWVARVFRSRGFQVTEVGALVAFAVRSFAR